MNNYRKRGKKKTTNRKNSPVSEKQNKNNDEIRVGTVIENLPNAMFRVEYEGQEGSKIAYLAGKMKLYRIRILVGDQVEVKIDPYGGKGRVIKRLRM